jgi:diguanylate cyclase (GGDEF)-like protein/PAS domain S-box-containing protein
VWVRQFSHAADSDRVQIVIEQPTYYDVFKLMFDLSLSAVVSMTGSPSSGPKDWSVYDALPAAVHVVDAEGCVVYANAAMHALLGLGLGALIGVRQEVFRDGGPLGDGGARRYVTPGACTLWVTESECDSADADGGRCVLRAVHDVTRFHQAETELRNERLMREVLFETLPTPVYIKDVEGRYIDCNEAFERYFGAPRSRIIDRTAYAVMDERAAKAHEDIDRGLVENWGRLEYQEETPQPDGSRRIVRIGKAVYCDSRGEFGGIIGVIHDMSRGMPNDARLQAILEQSPIGVSVSRRDNGSIIFANTRFAELIGLPRNHIVGSSARDYYVDDQQRAKVVERLKGNGSVTNMEVQFRRADGSSFWTLFTVNQAILEGVRVNLAWIYDYTERRNMEEALRDMASKDPLTGIYNRRSFMEMARQLLARSNRFNEAMAVLVLDVDHFKLVNDTYGHGAGDDALRQVAAGCAGVLREYDILGRLGGEEFIVAVPGATLEEAMVVAERLRRSVARSPIPVEGGASLNLTVSIGVCAVTGVYDSIETAIHRADLALYRAKHEGRNRVAVYESGM